MRFRIGIVIAFCIGYGLGAAGGRERHSRAVGRIDRAGLPTQVVGTIEVVGTKARAVANLGVERARDTVGVRLGWRDGDEAADAIVLEMATDLATALNGRRRAVG